MPRIKESISFSSRTPREGLKPRAEPYWLVLEKGRALGYRRGLNGGAWIARYYNPAGTPPRTPGPGRRRRHQRSRRQDGPFLRPGPGRRPEMVRDRLPPGHRRARQDRRLHGRRCGRGLHRRPLAQPGQDRRPHGLRLQRPGHSHPGSHPPGPPDPQAIARELALGEGAELARILVRRGLWVPSDDAQRKKLVTYLATVRVAGRARSVERVGWHGPAFLLPDEAFGEAAGGERVHLALDLEHAFRVGGSLADWQQEVGRHAQGNSRLSFALSCAFAAPMLGRLGMESGGFHFCGRSSKGKTTCIEAAGSAWGGPVYRKTWRATANGLEAVALAHCDCLLILDEQGQALPREAG